MWLLGGVFDGGGAVGQHGGHHDVHSGAHGYHIHVDVGTGEPAAPGCGMDEVALRHFGAHGPEALDVLVDGPYAEVAAAGHGHGGLAEAAQQRSQQIVGRPDAPCHIIGGMGAADGAAVDLHGVLIQHPHPCAQLIQNGEKQGHVADLGDVLDAAYAVHQQGGRDDGNGGVLGTASASSPARRTQNPLRPVTKQGTATVNDILVQNRHPLFLHIAGTRVACPETVSFIRPRPEAF